MIRDLTKRRNSHRIWLDEAKRLITSSLGIKPKKGGSPPSENRAINERVFAFMFGMELICLK